VGRRGGVRKKRGERKATNEKILGPNVGREKEAGEKKAGENSGQWLHVTVKNRKKAQMASRPELWGKNGYRYGTGKTYQEGVARLLARFNSAEQQAF